MLLDRYYDESLAQASYLIGCERTREAIIIDPNAVRDYAADASRRRLRLARVTETHVHADFLSGARALARGTGAELLVSAHGGDLGYRNLEASARHLHDGDSIDIGDVRLDVLHTPGHTPEHICFLVTDRAAGDRPMGLVSGDFLFVGDVGRPDLLERAGGVEGTMAAAARQLFESLQRLKKLPDYLQVWPGHGAGSACGKALGSVPQSTLGYERLYNPALQIGDPAAFVEWVLADQPDPPPYFAVMKQLNRDGGPERPAPGAVAEARWLDAAALQHAMDAGNWVVDVRPTADFARAHVPGTINIPLSKSFTTYAGTTLGYDQPIVAIVASHEQGYDVRSRLALVGMDVSAFAERSAAAEVMARSLPRHTPTIDAPELAELLAQNRVTVVDVRGTTEWKHGHLPRAAHIYLGDLLHRTTHLGRDTPIVVHCQSGSRAFIAASLLMARGFTDVKSFSAGFDGWRRAGLPIQEEA